MVLLILGSSWVVLGQKMYVLKLPMSQVISNTSVKVFFGTNFCLGGGGLRTSLSPCSAAQALTGLVSSPYDAWVAKKSEQRLSNRGRPVTFICLVVYFLRNPVPVFVVLLALLQRRFSVFVRHQTRIFCLHWIFGCLYLKVSKSNGHF